MFKQKTENFYITGSEKCVSIIVGIAVKRSINTFLDIDYQVLDYQRGRVELYIMHPTCALYNGKYINYYIFFEKLS